MFFLVFHIFLCLISYHPGFYSSLNNEKQRNYGISKKSCDVGKICQKWTRKWFLLYNIHFSKFSSWSLVYVWTGTLGETTAWSLICVWTPTWSLIETLGWLLLGPVTRPWDDSGLVMCKVLRRTLAWFCVGSLGWPRLWFLSWLFLTVMFWLGPWDDSSTGAAKGLLDDCSLGLWNEAGVSFLDLLWMTTGHLFRPIAEIVSKLCCPWDPSLFRFSGLNLQIGLMLSFFLSLNDKD